MITVRRNLRTPDGRELVVRIELEGYREPAFWIEDEAGREVSQETLGAETRRLVHAIVFDARDDVEARRADDEYARHVDK